MNNLYYQAPTQEIFDEAKAKAIEIWLTYDDQFGYASKKIERLNELENDSDSFMYMVAMFDPVNQRKLASILSDEAKNQVAIRLTAGGTPTYYNYFL